MSDRSGNYYIYRQAIDQDSAEPLVVTPQLDNPRLSPDGEWVVFVSFAKPEGVGTSAPSSQVRRVPLSGGPTQFVLTSHGYSDHRCVPAPSHVVRCGRTD